MRVLVLFPLLILAGCTTPKTVLKNEKTGQIAVCGGNVTSSMAGGLIGYNLQKNSDTECVDAYRMEGFKIIHQGVE